MHTVRIDFATMLCSKSSVSLCSSVRLMIQKIGDCKLSRAVFWLLVCLSGLADSDIALLCCCVVLQFGLMLLMLQHCP